MAGRKSGVRVAEFGGWSLGWLTAARLDLLSRHMAELPLRKGEVLYRPGQAARHLYCVLEGAVGLSLPGSEGRVLQLALVARGEFFGETALVRGWRRVSQATALEDSRVGRIDARTLVTEVCDLPWEPFTGLTEVVLKPLFMVSLRRSLFLVEVLADRVALALWEYATRPEARRAKGLLPSSLTHEQLAALVGASRPRVSLVLKRLERAGFLVRDGKRIRVQEDTLRVYMKRRYEFLI
jgi:CRP/FNR family transcriptional regulator, cyclic AMP receptor protein